MPPLDQDRGDSPSRADELARRQEMDMRKCKSGLGKRREIFLGYPHISAHFTATFAVFSYVSSARAAPWQAPAEAARAEFPPALGEGAGQKRLHLSSPFLI